MATATEARPVTEGVPLPPDTDAPPAEPAAPEAPKEEAKASPGGEQTHETRKGPIGFGKAGVNITSLAELWRFAQIIHASGMAPRGMSTVEKIVVAIQFGAEFGVPAMASVRNVAVIEGMPGWKGDMALALVRASGKCATYKKWHEGNGETRKAFVLTRRTDDPEPMVTEFGVADAILAGLWGMKSRNGEPMPWSQYPDRMLYYRALGFNLRDNFPEIMMGTATAEELADYPVIDVQATSATSSPRRAPAALAAAPPPDPLLASLGLQPAAATPVEEFVLLPPTAPAAAPAAAKDCEHPKCLPSRVAKLGPGRSIVCPDCRESLRN